MNVGGLGDDNGVVGEVALGADQFLVGVGAVLAGGGCKGGGHFEGLLGVVYGDLTHGFYFLSFFGRCPFLFFVFLRFCFPLVYVHIIATNTRKPGL